MKAAQAQIAAPLLRWYDQHARSLPWRKAGQAPYKVWLSEIMLQQTTVTAVKPFYEKFTKLWPTVDKLASAELDEVLRAWAGLGYYSRARNLHKCAQTVALEFSGKFPESEEDLRKLPGIGPYTAAAIIAIAFDKPANVVDGNVERVMSRLFAIKTPLPKLKAEVKAVAAPLVPTKRAGDYAQALMDLGATVCTPRSPACPSCPLRQYCKANAQGEPTLYPKRPNKVARPSRYGIAFIVTDAQGNLWLRRRAGTGLLGGMLEVPSSDWQENKPLLESALPAELKKLDWNPIRGPLKHVFSHFDLHLALYHARQKGRKPAGEWVSPQQARDLGLPGLTRKVIEIYEKYQFRAS
jgi:A/G-specific adenine glycosylase